MVITQVILVERKTARVSGWPLYPLGRFLALDARACRAFFVEPHADALAAKSLLAELPFDFDLAEAS